MNKNLQNIYTQICRKVKKQAIILFLLSVILTLSGCFSQWKGEEARITLLLSGDRTTSGRVVEYPPNNSTLNQLEHTITLTNGNQEITINANGGENIDAIVPSGRWKIDVNTYFEDIIYAKGYAEADLQPGEDYTVFITLYKAFYLITVNTSEKDGGSNYGSVTVQNRGGEGDRVTMLLNLVSGYKLSGLSSDPNIAFTGTGAARTFTMPKQNITIDAVFEETSFANVTVINFSGFQDEVIDLTQNPLNDIPLNGTLQVTVYNDSNFASSYKWYLNGSWQDYATNNTIIITINPGDFQIGIHSLMVVAYKGDIPYSKELIFRVKYV